MNAIKLKFIGLCLFVCFFADIAVTKPLRCRLPHERSRFFQRCLDDEYMSPSSPHRCIGCTKCQRGFEMDEDIACGNGTGHTVGCRPCPSGTYQPIDYGYSQVTCRSCKTCPSYIPEEFITPCTSLSDTVCHKCRESWYLNIDGVCKPCTYIDIIFRHSPACADLEHPPVAEEGDDGIIVYNRQQQK